MKKHWKIYCLLLCMCLALITASAFAATPGGASAGENGTVTVTLRVDSNTSAYTAKVGFTYDTSVLEFVSATGANGWTAPQRGNGAFGIAKADAPIAAGEIGSVTFRVRNAAAAGTYAVKAVVMKAVDTNYRNTSMQVSGGTVTLQGNGTQPGGTEPESSPQPGTNPGGYDSGFDSDGTYPCAGYTTAARVAVRSEAKANGKILARLEASGSQVTVTGEEYDSTGTKWYAVRTKNGKNGYIRGDLLRLDSAAGDPASGQPEQGSTPASQGQPDPYAGPSSEYPRIKFGDYTFPPGQIIPVYSAPSRSAWRGANGKASAATNGAVYCAGEENGWYLIIYQNSKKDYRVGYFCAEDVAGAEPQAPIQFGYIPATIRNTTDMSDDPAHFSSLIATLYPGTPVTLLADYRRSDMTLAYIEVYVDGKAARGFIRMSDLSR